MYLEFYGLNKKPFQISADPEFLWLGDKHREALAALRYGVEDNKGFLLLTGDVGTGKTTLINRLLASLGDDVLAASIPDPGLEVLDFYRYIAAIFNIEEPFASKGEFLIVFRRFLEASHAAGKKVVLIIDEAQR
ncbi:MAG TPA: type II secretory pathway protein, partial [Desulfobacterales bacterium]|nr:type II secretory pathway protein [Desulfobacterales bacterium]